MAFFDTAVQMTIAEVRDQAKEHGLQVAVESYADNVCVGARTKRELKSVVRSLLSTYRKYG